MLVGVDVEVKFQPMLLPASTLPLLVNAFQMAPPVALESLIDVKLTLTVPDKSLNIARVPAELLLIVTKLPGVP